MADTPYEAINIDEIPEPEYTKESDDPDWHPLRIHFGITAFGANAYTAPAPGRLIEEHTETDESGTQHEELYFVSEGHATFTVDGEEIDGPAGTFVYIRDPDIRRSAIAREPRTTVIALGGTPGEAFSVSQWEKKYDPSFAES
jgi:hypothetical protein